jgi:hypothetical protein
MKIIKGLTIYLICLKYIIFQATVITISILTIEHLDTVLLAGFLNSHIVDGSPKQSGD